MTDMRYRTVGDSGLVVSVVGLGGNNFGPRLSAAETAEVIHAALDGGINLIDTADTYWESEDYIGAALKGMRERAVLVTKFGNDLSGAVGPDWGVRASRRYIRKALERSLRRLQTDYIDLYMLHRTDGITPLEETLTALTELVREGKVRYIASSKLPAWRIVESEWIAKTKGLERFVAAENHYSLLERDAEREVIPACEQHKIGLLPFWPLANGLLTGKYRRDEQPPAGSRLADRLDSVSPQSWNTLDRIRTFAAARDLTMLQVAIGGLAAMPSVASVICGATSPEQVRQNIDAAGWVPSAEDLQALVAALDGAEAP
jgi:aryl-alcohol dehydrogenase-like predicted oxidoreductase